MDIGLAALSAAVLMILGALAFTLVMFWVVVTQRDRYKAQITNTRLLADPLTEHEFDFYMSGDGCLVAVSITGLKGGGSAMYLSADAAIMVGESINKLGLQAKKNEKAAKRLEKAIDRILNTQ